MYGVQTGAMGKGLEERGSLLLQPGWRLRLLGLGGATEARGKEGGAEHGDGGGCREKSKGSTGFPIKPSTSHRQSGPGRRQRSKGRSQHGTIIGKVIVQLEEELREV